MNFVRIACVLLSFILFFGCSKEDDYREISELPLSSAIYTQFNGNSLPTIYEFDEANGMHFEDARTILNLECDRFTFSTNVSTKDNKQGFVFGFLSLVNLDKLEANQKIFHQSSDFVKILDQEYVIMASDACINLPNKSHLICGLYLNEFDIEGNEVQILKTVTSDLELIVSEYEPVMFGDYGYLLLDIEFNAVSFTFPGLNEFPVHVKFSHALRLPEIDKW